jgi:hypothetical protein
MKSYPMYIGIKKLLKICTEILNAAKSSILGIDKLGSLLISHYWVYITRKKLQHIKFLHYF